MSTPAAANAKTLGLLMLMLSPVAMAASTIPISDEEALYAALDNPAYDGATLVLAPGTYDLSAVDQNGNPRSKEGRIELRRDMTIRGVIGNEGAVIISAYYLPDTSFLPNDGILGPNAAIRMGLGENSLEWLTVLDAWKGQANIDTGLQVLDTAPAHIRIDHVSSSGSVRGLNVMNFGVLGSNQTLEVDITDSDFFENTVDPLLAFGVRIGNFQGTVNGTVNVRMSGNRFWGQDQGCLIVNNNAVSSFVNVVSSGNRFYKNSVGMNVIGALSANATKANGNTITVDSYGDQFVDNSRKTGIDHAGLLVIGAEITSNTVGGGSNNTVNVRQWGSRIQDNRKVDLYAVGARHLLGQTAVLSQNNRITIEIHDAGKLNENGRWEVQEEIYNVLPVGLAYGNLATVTRD
jgi:hypothetical protein